MENKEQILKILELVESGKLTPEEAEEIIAGGSQLDPSFSIAQTGLILGDRGWWRDWARGRPSHL